jgi:hypothetical protein
MELSVTFMLAVLVAAIVAGFGWSLGYWVAGKILR